jgi:hypothetical protein
MLACEAPPSPPSGEREVAARESFNRRERKERRDQEVKVSLCSLRSFVAEAFDEPPGSGRHPAGQGRRGSAALAELI